MTRYAVNGVVLGRLSTVTLLVILKATSHGCDWSSCRGEDVTSSCPVWVVGRGNVLLMNCGPCQKSRGPEAAMWPASGEAYELTPIHCFTAGPN